MAFFKFIIFAISMFMLSARAEQVFQNGVQGTAQVYEGVAHNCGNANSVGGKEYLTWDYTYLCLVFELKGQLRKVLFRPRVDKFEVLEIQGLYDIFKDQKEAAVRALSNGVYSRESHFKLNNGVAEVLNLVVTINDGQVRSLRWKNGCVPRTCNFEDCVENEYDPVLGPGQTAADREVEKNCFVQGCASSTATNNCDTKVYVTWEGNDKENRYCESDNYRITNLMQHSIQSYFDSAINVSPAIVKNAQDATSEQRTAAEAAAEGIAPACEALATGPLRSRQFQESCVDFSSPGKIQGNECDPAEELQLCTDGTVRKGENCLDVGLKGPVQAKCSKDQASQKWTRTRPTPFTLQGRTQEGFELNNESTSQCLKFTSASDVVLTDCGSNTPNELVYFDGITFEEGDQ